MSTIKTSNIQNGSSSSVNIALNTDGSATFAQIPNSPFSFLRNRIINGHMMIDQRYGGAAIANSGGYTVDRWADNYAGSGRYTAQQSTDAPSGFVNSLIHTVTTAVSPGASDVYQIFQQIEGLNTYDLAWGTSAAKTVTVSFWVKSSITGSYAFRLCNSAGNRSYVAAYSISVANTWEYKTITIPGDITGTWLTNNGIGVTVTFDLGSGSNLNAPAANTWYGADYRRLSSTVNWISTNGATFYVTGVQFETGSIATPFERRLYPHELMMCQRYLIVTDGYAVTSGIADSASTIWAHTQFPVTMRGVPSVSASGQLIFSDDYSSDYTASSTSITNGNVGTTGARLRFSGFSGLTLGRFYGGIGGSGKIVGSAEL